MKPSNILITPNDHAKVLDLGLALVQGEAPTDRRVVGGQGYVVGTMDYIAPEQADDAFKADPRADLYGLGCTLYFALTGRPPFTGSTPQEKIHCHHTQEPPPVEQLNPAVPPAFAALVRRMMAKRPEQRFASAAEAQEELQKWVAGEPVRPMDRKEDAGYREAVTALEAKDPSSDFMEPVLTGEPAGPDPAVSGLFPRVRRYAPTPVWVWWLCGALGLGTLVMVIITVVLLVS
jgi:serine/threonine protein kinase